MNAELVLQWPIVLVPAIVAALAAGALLLAAGASRFAALLRLVLALVLGLSLAQPVLVQGRHQGRLVLVDRSTAVADGGAEEALGVLAPTAAGIPVLQYGGDSDVPDLPAALDWAERALPGGGQVWLLASRTGDLSRALRAADGLRGRGLRLDVLPLPVRRAPDSAITALHVPGHWRAGEDLPVAVAFRGTAPGPGRVTLRSGQRVVASAPVTVVEALASVRLSVPAPVEGPLAMEARLEQAEDVVPENNVRHGFTWIHPPPRTLVVGDGEGAVLLADALTAGGMAATVLVPGRLPGRLSALREWDVLALVDVPADAMGLEQQAAVAAFAAELGGGVLLTAGRQSFLPGGWSRTALERISPVSLEPPPRDRHDEVALLLLVDQSASMGSTEGAAGLSKLALAREAAALATEALHAGDRIGVVSYDDDARWLVPLDQVVGQGDATAVEEALGGLTTGGGTRISSALELGLPALAALDVPTRHAVLLTDGRDFHPDMAAYERLVSAARAAGVTLSTIALGSDADQALLARLAAQGRGRFHVAAEPADLPRLTVQESETVRARSEQQGHYPVLQAGAVPHPALAGLRVASLPALGGYLSTTARPGAAVVLEVPDQDPLLATWQYGAGRVSAWLSDTGEEWAAAWPGTSADLFWPRQVRHLASAPQEPGLALATTATVDGLRLVVDARDEEGRTVDLADVTVRFGPAGADHQVSLPQRAPGRYWTELEILGPSAYPAEVQVTTNGAGVSRVGNFGLVVPPRHPPPPEAAAAGHRAALAAAGGGQVLAGAEPLARAPRASVDLWPWLVVLAAILWPLDVALGLGDGRWRWPLRGGGENARNERSAG